jgi:hypothetical protein
MTLSMSRFSIAAITGLMLLSFTPSSAQAFCLWGYGNSCYRSSSFVPIAGAALGANDAAGTGFAPTAGAAMIAPGEQGDPNANRYDFGPWRPANAAALQSLFSCDPNEWTRKISEATGETLYSNNWTCQPGRASARGGNRTIKDIGK